MPSSLLKTEIDAELARRGKRPLDDFQTMGLAVEKALGVFAVERDKRIHRLTYHVKRTDAK